MRAHRCRVVATLLRAEQAVARAEVEEYNPGSLPPGHPGNAQSPDSGRSYNPWTREQREAARERREAALRVTRQSAETMRVHHLRNPWSRAEGISGWRELVDAPVGAVDASGYSHVYTQVYSQPYFHSFQESHRQEISRIVGGTFGAITSIQNNVTGVKFEIHGVQYVFEIVPTAVAYCQLNVVDRSSRVCLDRFYCPSAVYLHETLCNLPAVTSAWPEKRDAMVALGGVVGNDGCSVQFLRIRLDMTFKPGMYCKLVVMQTNRFDTTFSARYCRTLEEVRTGLVTPVPGP